MSIHHTYATMNILFSIHVVFNFPMMTSMEYEKSTEEHWKENENCSSPVDIHELHIFLLHHNSSRSTRITTGQRNYHTHWTSSTFSTTLSYRYHPTRKNEKDLVAVNNLMLLSVFCVHFHPSRLRKTFSYCRRCCVKCCRQQHTRIKKKKRENWSLMSASSSVWSFPVSFLCSSLLTLNYFHPVEVSPYSRPLYSIYTYTLQRFFF